MREVQRGTIAVPEFCGDKVDDRLLFVRDFGDPRRQPRSLEQLDGQIVTVRARATIGHDEQLSPRSTSETDLRRARGCFSGKATTALS